jgi:mRNA interferase MazF
MPRFERWAIVSVPFPYVERPIRQRRPALVVLTGMGAAHDLVWVLMITAAANRGWPEDVPIDDHAAAGLPIPSIVRTAKIATIAAPDAHSLGVLPPQASVRVAQILRQRFR